MLDMDTAEATDSLHKIKKLCRIISLCLKIVFGLMCACWIVAVWSMVATLMNPGTASESIGNVNIVSTVLFLVYGLVIAALFVIFIQIFSSAAQGETPFSMAQVKRLRLIALLLLLYAILDCAGAFFAAVIQFESINSGYISTNASAIFAINFAPFVAAVVVFAFSFVFKYGVLLQEFSDETL